MGCTGCKEDKENMVAKECPTCGRRFIGSSEVCGWCNAAKKKADATATDAEVEETK